MIDSIGTVSPVLSLDVSKRSQLTVQMNALLPHVRRPCKSPLVVSVQELKAHCGMLVRTWNELQRMHSRLLQAAGGHPHFPDGEYKQQHQQPPSPQQQGNPHAGKRAPETPEQAAMGGPLEPSS